ncbi:hypothetical protein QNI16_14650 [Cytophagaceae bacterium YF14B1]|uniref:Uncharacterized protein n=1 Tax=Xanthocytophaga flava TaxID=3048013 RepID=A0AAE3QLW6_9BACT|nr:hypothetical protein [Xanthocytophaga flavus]MDJ1481737.1 hypothetical protein [Xanthocytophaga flavus]
MSDIQAQNRLTALKQKMDEFGVSYQRLADYSERSLTTISKMFGSNDTRYKTDGNISAAEQGLEKILDEYRAKLCGKPSL